MKFMYVFENELGIGYIKQLKVDGSGLTNTVQCVANLDPRYTRLSLDPEYAEHMLLGEGEFDYSKEYHARKAYREEAIAKNNKLLIDIADDDRAYSWASSLKKGDEFYIGYDYSECNKHVVTSVVNKNTAAVRVHYLFYGSDGMTEKCCSAPTDWRGLKLMMQKPYPLVDPLCGTQK